MADDLDHLFISGFTDSRPFKSSLRARSVAPPPRDRSQHGRALLRQIRTLVNREHRLRSERAGRELPVDLGTTITLRVAERTLNFGSLEWSREGIKVLTVQNRDGLDFGTLFVPAGQLGAFERRVQDYLKKNSVRNGLEGGPKNAALVNAIESIGPSAFEDLWTDGAENLPDRDVERSYQLWLRVPKNNYRETVQQFTEAADSFEIEVVQGYLRFPERAVVAVKATRRHLEEAIELLDLIAEIRETQPVARSYLADLKQHEQAAFIEDLEQRLELPDPAICPYVTVLDTGVNRHRLLNPLLANADKHTVVGAWQAGDHEGHGTEMAGIAVYGDLALPLGSNEEVLIEHRLESVKILPPDDQTAEDLYGTVTEVATRLVEAQAPNRRRTYSMAVTSTGNTFGFPSDWSAAVDRLAFGLPTSEAAGDEDEDDLEPSLPRLFSISAGNVPVNEWDNYPAANTTSMIENPGQSWNGLTVGAHTDLATIDRRIWPAYTPLAQAGDLSPCSRTSRAWEKGWPLKPEVVAEGGNGCREAGTNAMIIGPEPLRLLTTSHEPHRSPLAETGDTSAAATEVARLAARISARYPSYWPETQRALIVHGATWTPRMLTRLPRNPGMEQKFTLLRLFGYGRVDPRRSIESASERATMVLQETITPYIYDEKTHRVVLGNLNMHSLPWPKAALEELEGGAVRLNVTLSYFIAPNPARRGWKSKFRYQSHGLRFAVKGATETSERFAARINLAARQDEDDELYHEVDGPGWKLGSKVRTRGSIHRDIWEGNATDLAEKSEIAIFPVGGWWKDIGKHGVSVRYSLIVSLELADNVVVPVDLYTPIETAIAVPVA